MVVQSIYEYQAPGSDEWLELKDLALKDWPSNPYVNHDGRVDAFWRTLILDTKGPNERAPTERGDNSEALLDSAITGHADNALRQSAHETQDLSLENWLKKSSAKQRFGPLFRTERSYLGTGCRHVRPGDKVAILWAGRLPFVLREFVPV